MKVPCYLQLHGGLWPLILCCILFVLPDVGASSRPWNGYRWDRVLFYNCSKDDDGQVVLLPCDFNKDGIVEPIERKNCNMSATTSTLIRNMIWTTPNIDDTVGRSNDAMDNFTMETYQHEKLLTEELRLISTSLSIIGCLFIIVSYIILKEIRTKAFSIIFFLSIVDLLGSITMIVDIVPAIAFNIADRTHGQNIMPHRDLCALDGCIAMAAAGLYFELSSMLWSWIIATNMLLVVVLKVKLRNLRFWQFFYHALAWILPVIATTIAVLMGSLGDAGYRCWIQRNDAGKRAEMSLLVLTCVIFVFNVVCFGCVIGWFHMSYASAQRKGVAYRLSLYALVFLVVRLPSLVSYFAVYNTTKHSLAQIICLYADAVIGPLQGLGDGIVYGLNKQVVKTYKEKWIRHCGQCSKHGYERADFMGTECSSFISEYQSTNEMSKKGRKLSQRSRGGSEMTEMSIPEKARNRSHSGLLKEPLCGLTATLRRKSSAESTSLPGAFELSEVPSFMIVAGSQDSDDGEELAI